MNSTTTLTAMPAVREAPLPRPPLRSDAERRRARIARLRRLGVPVSEIAALVGVTRRAVYDHLEALGEHRPRRAARAPGIPR